MSSDNFQRVVSESHAPDAELLDKMYLEVIGSPMFDTKLSYGPAMPIGEAADLAWNIAIAFWRKRNTEIANVILGEQQRRALQGTRDHTKC